jgi:hypothetical protein
MIDALFRSVSAAFLGYAIVMIDKEGIDQEASK